MRSSLVLVLVCAFFLSMALGQADDSNNNNNNNNNNNAAAVSSSAMSAAAFVPAATSSSYNGVTCAPDDAYGPSDDMIIYIGSSTGNNNPNYYCGTTYYDYCYCTGQCFNEVDANGNTVLTPLPKCSSLKAQATHNYYGTDTWSGLNVTQLIIVVVLVSICALFAIAAIIRALIRTRKAASALAADDNAVPVIEVVTEQVHA